MTRTELYIEPLRLSRNPTNGRFIHGSIPHNKGKRIHEYMSPESIERLRLGHKNLKGRSDFGGWNKKKVIGIRNGVVIGIFASAAEAGRRLKLQRRNISHCCCGERQTCGGIMWFFVSDHRWGNLIKNE